MEFGGDMTSGLVLLLVLLLLLPPPSTDLAPVDHPRTLAGIAPLSVHTTRPLAH
jgi:hypothetical protein